MKVLFTIWISAVLIQEVVPSTLVRFPRHASNNPSMIQTEYEAKYEQKGKQGNESFSSVSGKQHFVHDNCSENWNSFAEKCASLIKDLVASLANAVSSNPGDATNLQLHIKNTFKHFDNTHNCTCLNHTGKSLSDLDLSSLFNNITISTVSPSSNQELASGDSYKRTTPCDDRKDVAVVEKPESNGEGSENDTEGKPVAVIPTAQQQKQTGALTDAENLNPEHHGLNDDSTNNSRRQVNYPQVSKQPKSSYKSSQYPFSKSPEQLKNGKIPPFLVTPRPNYPAKSPLSPVAGADPTSSASVPETESFPSNASPMNTSSTPSSASQLSGSPTVVPAVIKPQQPSANEATNSSGTNQQPFASSPVLIPVSGGKDQPTLAIPAKEIINSETTEPEILIPVVPVNKGDSSKPELMVPVVPVTNPTTAQTTLAPVFPPPTTSSPNSKPVVIAPGSSDSEPAVPVPTDSQISLPVAPVTNSPDLEAAVIIPKQSKHDSSKSKPVVVVPVPSDPNSESSGVSAEPLVPAEAVSTATTPYPSSSEKTQPSTVIPVINSNSGIPKSPVYKPLPYGPGSNPSSQTPVVLIPEEDGLPAFNYEKYTTPAPTTESLPVVKPVPEAAKQPAASPVDSITVYPTKPAPVTSESLLEQQPCSNAQPSTAGPGNSQPENVLIVTPSPAVEIATVIPKINQQMGVTPEIIESSGAGSPAVAQTPVASGAGNQPVSSGVLSPESGVPTEQPMSTIPSFVYPWKYPQKTTKPEELFSAEPVTAGSEIGKQQPSSDGIPGTTPVPLYFIKPAAPGTADQQAALPTSTQEQQQPVAFIPLKELSKGEIPELIPQQETPLQNPPAGSPGTDAAPVEPSSGSQPQDAIPPTILKPVKPVTAIPNSEQSSNGEAPAIMAPIQPETSVPSGEEQPGSEKVPAVLKPVSSVPSVPKSESQLGSGATPLVAEPVQTSGGEQPGNEGVPAVLQPITPAPVVPSNETQSGSGSVPSVLEPVQPGAAAPGGGEKTGNEGIPVVIEPVTPTPVVPKPVASEPIAVAPKGGEQSGDGGVPAVLVPVTSSPVTPNSEAEASGTPPAVLQPVAPSGGEQSGNEGTPVVSEPIPVVPSGGESGTEPAPTSPSQSSVITPNKEEDEDTVLLKPTTFQTTSADPTPAPPVVVYQPFSESTKPPVPQGSDSGLLVRPSTSPQTTTTHDEDDDDDEDCCSCESCTEEEISDPKQYKENACKNLEEARKELKAIFDKIKKKLKCFSKKAPQTITTS